jgi:hypothetical protein
VSSYPAGLPSKKCIKQAFYEGIQLKCNRDAIPGSSYCCPHQPKRYVPPVRKPVKWWHLW